MQMIVIGLFAYVSLACVAGAFSTCYQATLTQRVGVAVVSIWAAWCAYLVHDTHMMPGHAVLGGAGMAIFATGTIIKTYRWKVWNAKTN